MGEASISISIDGRWNGAGAVGSAVSDLGRLNAAVSGSASKMAAYLSRQEGQATRISRLAASTSKSTTQALSEVGQSIAERAGELYRVGDSLESLGATMTKGLTAPLVGFAAKVGESAVTFDTAMANVRKVTNMTSSQLDALGRSALELSQTQPVDAATILNVEALGAQLGIAAGNLESFAKVVTGLDIATDMDAETAATEMARFANIVGMAEDEFDNYGATIVAIGNNMATTESEVSNMAQRFASAGHQAGLSSADILALSASMSSLGIRAEMGGSALSQVFVNISKAVSLGGDDLEAFAGAAGMSAEQFAEAWRTNATDAFTALLQGIHDSTEAGKDMNVTMSELGINQIRQSDVMRRMAGSVDKVTEAVNLSRDAWRENTALQAEVDQRNESLASRIEVLRNRVEAVATTVGVPLVEALISFTDAAQPMIDAAASAAQAFADADEGTQRLVVGIGGAVAAAGPLATALGKGAKGVSGLMAALGGAAQDAAAFGDAMGTVDGAQLRVYASAKGTAAQLGAQRNAVAKAAGGVDNYVSAWEAWFDASKQVESKTRALKALENKSAAASDRTRASVERKTDALLDEISAATKARDKNRELIDGWQQAAGVSGKLSDTTTTLGGKFKTFGSFVASSALEMGKQALAMGALSLAATAVVGGISALVAMYQREREHQQLVESATRSLADAQREARDAATSQAEGLGEVSSSAEETMRAVAELNQTFSDSMGEFYTRSATLDAYLGTIEELADKSGLTATEQERLKVAVKGYNDVTGDSVEVTDAANGKLSVSTEQLKKNAEAWRKNAEAKVYQEYATEAIKKQVEAEKSLEGARETLTQKNEALAAAQAKLDEYMKQHNGTVSMSDATYQALAREVGVASQAQQEAQKSVDELNSTYDEQAKNLEWVNVKMAELSANLSGPLRESFEALPRDMQSVGLGIASSLASGVETGTVSAQAAAEFLTNSVNRSVASMPDGMRPIGLSAAQALADGVSSGQFSVEEANNAIFAMSQGRLSDLTDLYSSKGVELPQGLAGAIAAYQGLPADATSAMKDEVALVLAGGDTKRAAELLGHDIDSGLADGIRNGTLSEEQAARLGEDVIAKARETLDSHSPSLAFLAIGGDVDSGLAQGISENSEGPLSAVTSLGQALAAALSGLVPGMSGKGAEASSSLASGLSSGLTGVWSSALGLAQSAASGVSGTASSLGGEGTSAGALFASGVGSGVAGATARAKSLRSGAETGVSGTAAALGMEGSSASLGFSSGIAAQIGAASGNARSLGAGARGGVSGTASAMGAEGLSASSLFASGIGAGRGTTSSAAASVAGAARGMRNVGDMYGSGSHLASNFASGIRSGIGWVASAARAIADRAASILHFSVPDEGPWSGSERGGFTSGLHLGRNFAEGMRASSPAVEDAARMLAGAARPDVVALSGGGAAPPGAAAAASGGTTNYYSLTVDGTRAQSVTPQVAEAMRVIFGEFGLTSSMGVGA
ncbi:phage tail tape measure protein [uncultured Parolsenella sp.]|uniref:phage tail tape measure protein n=1 Tax=uncultured Parolsenella sp. TaxID=2083008 RepID=UPI0027D93577|nr:phage tail tape measure protein [uncultured Parolsenella sp.]